MATENTDSVRWRLGAVSFLNAAPLVSGLEHDPRVELLLDVPARLPGLLDSGRVDAGLVPVIDLVQGGRDWQIVSDACIGCDGETLTVRVFSRIPPDQITRLHADQDSHSSVVLARVIWRELYGRELNVVPLTGKETVEECEAILLIGDKVVTQTLIEYDQETDLGAAWKSLTSLPFVFAVWAAPRGRDCAELGQMLNQARDRGKASAEMIAADVGPVRGWPVSLAKRYLCQRIKYDLGDRQRAGMARFLELAKSHGLVGREQELVFA